MASEDLCLIASLLSQQEYRRMSQPHQQLLNYQSAVRCGLVIDDTPKWQMATCSEGKL